MDLEIWDTAGQERFRSLDTPMYYRGASGAVVCYDATDAESFAHVPGWYTQLRMMGERGVVVGLCGSKLDLATGAARAVASAGAESFAATQGLAVFRETSAKTGENVEEFFVALSRGMLERRRECRSSRQAAGRCRAVAAAPPRQPLLLRTPPPRLHPGGLARLSRL